MRAAAIEPGRDYWLRVRMRAVKAVPGGQGWPATVTRKRVTVTATDGREVTVQAERWVATNASEFASPARALVDGHLRWQPSPQRWTVPARDILAPAPPRPEAAPANAPGDRASTGDSSERHLSVVRAAS